MVEINVTGLDKISKLAEKYTVLSEKHVNNGIRRALIRIQDKAKKNAPFGTTGQLRGNWIIQMGRFQGSLQSGAKSEGNPYGIYVEEGTRPHYVSPKSIELWARRRGLNPYAVAKSIGKKGTKPNPFFKQSIEMAEVDVQAEFDKIITNILAEI